MSAAVDRAPARVVAPVAPALVRFALACVPTLALAAVVLGWVWPDEAGRQAVRTSLWIALPLQLVTFAIVRLVAREQVFAAFGLGSLLRFATLGAYAFVGVEALGLAAAPALLALAVYLFLSTLLEPLFLRG